MKIKRILSFNKENIEVKLLYKMLFTSTRKENLIWEKPLMKKELEIQEINKLKVQLDLANNEIQKLKRYGVIKKSY